MTELLPVTLLSGFLGAGKTTLLKYILQNKQDLKCAVIVNDMAELNIDANLISNAKVLQKEEKIVQMQNGCICCTLREDLLTEVVALANAGLFNYLIIESTGISEPMQVAETFTFDFEDDPMEDDDASGVAQLTPLKDIARLDTCVTVVDALNFFDVFNTAESVMDRYKDSSPEDERTLTELMCDQIEFANVIVINKIDMVSESQIQTIKSLLTTLNPSAEILTSNYSRVDLKKVLDTKKFDFAQAASAPGWLKSLQEEVKPESEEFGVYSFVYRARTPFHPTRLWNLLSKRFVIQEEGIDDENEESESSHEEGEESESDEIDNSTDLSHLDRTGAFASVLRSKGFLGIHGEWSQAGVVASVRCGGPWFCEIPEEEWPEEAREAIKKDFTEETKDRRQELVFIGQFTPSQKLEIIGSLNNCLWQPSDMDDQASWLPWPTASHYLHEHEPTEE